MIKIVSKIDELKNELNVWRNKYEELVKKHDREIVRFNDICVQRVTERDVIIKILREKLALEGIEE